jgi:hypothetical protein
MPSSTTVKSTKTPEDEINMFLKHITVSHPRRLESSIMVLLKPHTVNSTRQAGPGGKMIGVKHGRELFPLLPCPQWFRQQPSVQRMPQYAANCTPSSNTKV